MGFFFQYKLQDFREDTGVYSRSSLFCLLERTEITTLT